MLSRRDWMRLAPVLGAAVSAAQPPASDLPQRVSKEMLRQALGLIGLEFTDEQLTMMLPGVNRQLASCEALRKIDVPLDTEPAFRFVPVLPGRKTPAGPARFLPGPPPRPPRFGKVEDLAFCTVRELASLIRSKRVTPVELAGMYLDRLKRDSPKLNCTITLTGDLAMAQAERATREIRRGRYRGVLHGIPWGAKDLFATKGIRTTWGAEPFENQVFDYDATVVERLEKAGAVLLAKLSMGALAQGGLWFGGMTKTPWNLEQTSSGSSAGSASATAAGLVGFALGTETLGSIVSPSTRCGVAGLRPTYGRVSRYGAMGLSWTMDKVGPICRSMEDCALVLRAIHGPDGRDLSVADVPLHYDLRVPLAKLRIGYLAADFEKIDADRRPIYEAALAALREAGARLQPMALPAFAPGPLRAILNAEAAAAFDDLTRSGGVDKLRGQGANDWPNSFRTSRTITAVEYIRAQRARTLLMREMEKLMDQWDVFVAPPFSDALTVTNLTGHPQAVVPCGFHKELPQGITFTGRLYEEGTLARVALAYERATKWHALRPKPVS